MDQYQPTCPSCAYYDSSGDYPVGRCRRYAPRPTMELLTEEDTTGAALWPWVEETEWCGEHKPAAKNKVAT